MPTATPASVSLVFTVAVLLIACVNRDGNAGEVAFAAAALCHFDRDNPYPCCRNAPRQYGNCTGAAWQQMRAAGWAEGLPRVSWGDARHWRTAALAAGYLVDDSPSLKSVGVADAGQVLANHVALVTAIDGNHVTTVEQQCGRGLAGGTFAMTRPWSAFNAGFIRAPIPAVAIRVSSGEQTATNDGTLTVDTLSGQSRRVRFDVTTLHSNIASPPWPPPTVSWRLSEHVVSTATGVSLFLDVGRYLVSAHVTNGMGVTAIAVATVVVR